MPAGFNLSERVNLNNNQGINHYLTFYQKEINKLLKKGVFRIIPVINIPNNA
jgi:hypothetical protein